MKLIVGLGNPGEEYAKTRHNLGWMALERIHPDGWKADKKFDGEVIKDGDTVYLKPTTYMNRSGQAVRAAADFYKVAPQDVVVVSDDLDLPFGEVRYRSEGGSGGHNGLEDLIKHLGTKEFGRIRIGIGRTTMDPTDYVLSRFTAEEEEQLPGILDQAIEELGKHE